MNSHSPLQECPSVDVLAALVDGTSVDGNSVSIEQHIGECANCQATLESLTGSERWVELRRFLTEDDTIEFGIPNSGGSRITGSITSSSSLPDIDGFEVLSEVGRGGMGVVYRARDLALNRIVAIKMLIGGALSGPDRLSRFQNEAKSIARLEHSLIVQIYSVGEHHGMPFLVLEYVDGTNLKELCRDKNLSQREATQCIARVADALHFAHQNGVVHRDLKPENILISTGVDLIPKITDFGLARMFDVGADTASETVLGTPAYMAPEVLNGSSNSIPIVSDVYGLGTLLYFVLFGGPPFQESTTMETLSAVTNSPVRFPDSPKVAPDLCVILLKCLEKRPADRYPTAGELAKDLNRFLEHIPINARPMSSFGRARRWCYRRPAVASLLAVLLVVLATSCSAIAIQTSRVRDAREDTQKYELQTQAMQNVVDFGLYVRTLGDTNDAWNTNDYERMQMHLNSCPPNFRSWEWKLLNTTGRNSLVGSHRLDSSITAMKESPGGNYLAAGTIDGAVDISRISDQSLDVRSVPDLRSISRLQIDRAPVQYVCFNNDETKLIVGYVDRFAIVDLTSDPPSIDQSIENNGLTGVAFEPGGEWFVTCSRNGRIARYSRAGELICEVTVPSEHFVGISCTETLRLATRNWYLLECDPDSLKVTSRVKTHITRETVSKVVSAYYSDDGHEVAMQDSENSIRMVLAETGERLRTLAGHSNRILNAQFSGHRERLATCDSGGTTRLWNLQPDVARDASPRIVCSESVGAVAWLQQGAYMAVGRENGSINIYPAGRALTHSIFDVASHTVDSLYENVDRAVLSVHPHLDLVATSGYNGRVFLRDTRTLTLVRELERHPDRVRGVAFVSDGQRLLTACNDGMLREFETATGDLIFEQTLYQDGNCSALHCSPDGRVAVFGGGKDDYAVVWDVESRSVLRNIRDKFERTIRDIHFDQDGSRFAIAGGPEVHVFDTQTGEELLCLKGHGGRSYRCRFSRDGRWIVTNANDSTTRIWDATTGQQMALFRNANGFCFSPDSHRVLIQPIAGMESEVQFVDVASGFVVWSCRSAQKGIETMTFSPDGNRLFAICRDAKLRVWNVDPPSKN